MLLVLDFGTQTEIFIMSDTEEKPEVETPEDQEEKEASTEDSGIEKDVEKLSVEDEKPEEEIGKE